MRESVAGFQGLQIRQLKRIGKEPESAACDGQALSVYAMQIRAQ
jgi:hypothetical protein